jgi:hypothetical protein
MELQQLKYFREVAEREHVTRASEKLFVSQSAVSRAVNQLEEELRECHSSIAKGVQWCCHLMGEYSCVRTR